MLASIIERSDSSEKRMEHKKKIKCEIWNDSMQNWKSKPIQKAQLIIADVPYNIGTNFYGSNPVWYQGGDNKTAKANLQAKRLSHPTSISTCMSISISVVSLCGKSRTEAAQEGDRQTLRA